MKSSNDPRHNARRVALGVLFCWLFSDSNDEKCLLLTSELLELQNNQIDGELTYTIISGAKENKKDIDDIIQRCAPEWPIDKISKIDLIILRISVYEILYFDGTPEKVVIDEAVELAKEFGGDTSGKFVNGVLGTVVEIKEESKSI